MPENRPASAENDAGLAEHEIALRSLWRDLAEKCIEHGVDWPRIALTLFRDLDEAGAVLRKQEDRVRGSLANIGHLKAAQTALMRLGVDWAEAGRILSAVQSTYVALVNDALLDRETSCWCPNRCDGREHSFLAGWGVGLCGIAPTRPSVTPPAKGDA